MINHACHSQKESDPSFQYRYFAIAYVYLSTKQYLNRKQKIENKRAEVVEKRSITIIKMLEKTQGQ